MTLEQSWTRRENETFGKHSPEVDRDPFGYAAELGRYALDLSRFTLLGEITSPHEKIRQGLKNRVIDQDPAIDAVIDALDRSNIRLDTDHRPVANLAFLGPTGVGKSETAKTLAELIGEGNLVKIDCSNFSHGHEVSSLLGAPPSYVGREQQPALSKERVEKPGTVILFDEIEKGSQPLYNLMLQIMGDGQLQLNTGDTVSFRDSVIVLTSNLGAREMSSQLSPHTIGFGEQERSTDKQSLENVARKSFVDFFPPEFINRLNQMVVFHPLGSEGLDRVLNVKLSEANEYYEQQYGVHVSLSEQTRKELIATAAAEPHLGARPLIRALENNIQSTFGRYNDSDMLPEGTHVHVVHHTELPDSRKRGDSPFLFMAQHDPTIRKRPQLLAIEPARSMAAGEGDPIVGSVAED